MGSLVVALGSLGPWEVCMHLGLLCWARINTKGGFIETLEHILQVLDETLLVHPNDVNTKKVSLNSSNECQT